MSADKLRVRIWNLHGTVDFGLKWKILKTLTESFLTVAMPPVESRHMCYQGIQPGKEKEAELPVALDVINLFSVALKHFEKFVVLTL